MGEIKADKTLDIKGMHSPRLQEVTKGTLDNMHFGQVLRVITDDKTTIMTIPAFCNAQGYMLEEIREYDGTLFYTIRK